MRVPSQISDFPSSTLCQYVHLHALTPFVVAVFYVRLPTFVTFDFSSVLPADACMRNCTEPEVCTGTDTETRPRPSPSLPNPSPPVPIIPEPIFARTRHMQPHPRPSP